MVTNKSSSNKIFKTMLSIFLLALIIIIMFFAWKNELLSKTATNNTTKSSQVEEVNWRTYNNNDYQYSLEVPEDWFEVKMTHYPPSSVDKNTPVILSNIDLIASYEEARISLKVWKKGSFFPQPPLTKATLDGLPADRSNNDYDSRIGFSDSVSVTRGDYVYQIALQVSKPERVDYYESIFTQILRTFHFASP